MERTSAAPARRISANFASRVPVAITCAPAARSSWIAIVPTPLEPPCTTTRWPGWTSRTPRASLAVTARGIPAPRTGALTFGQRFGGLVYWKHFYLLTPEGVFAETDAGLAFRLLPVPPVATCWRSCIV